MIKNPLQLIRQSANLIIFKSYYILLQVAVCCERIHSGNTAWVDFLLDKAVECGLCE